MRWMHRGVLRSYEPTFDDLLWLARAVACEGAPLRAVAWTLVQRFALLFPQYPTVAEFVRAYAQPVNPRWFPDGDKFLDARRAHHPSEWPELDKRAQRRVECADAAWDDLPDRVRRAAAEALYGECESPVPRAVHYRGSTARRGENKKRAFERAELYAASRNDLVDVVRIPEGYSGGVNWFFTSPASNSLQMLAPGDEPAMFAQEDRQQTPKEQWPEPPVGAPTGPGWGWCWAYSEQHSYYKTEAGESGAPSDPSGAGVELVPPSTPAPDGSEAAPDSPALPGKPKRRRILEMDA